MIKEITEKVYQALKEFGVENATVLQDYNVHDPDRKNQELISFTYSNERFYLAITKVERKTI